MTALAINEAKDNFTRVIHDAESGEPLLVTRHGKGAAVIIGYDDWERSQKGPDTFAGRLADFSARYSASSVDDETDPFDEVRDKSLDRKIEF